MKGKITVSTDIKKESILINKSGRVEAEGDSTPEVLAKKYGKKNPFDRFNISKPSGEEEQPTGESK